jgi:hypothetical protein
LIECGLERDIALRQIGHAVRKFGLVNASRVDKIALPPTGQPGRARAWGQALQNAGERMMTKAWEA